jgi:hypothetical protein
MLSYYTSMSLVMVPTPGSKIKIVFSRKFYEEKPKYKGIYTEEWKKSRKTEVL